MPITRTAILLCLFLLYVGLAAAEERLWYGLLHSHTAFSDGSGTPEEAFKTARKNGLDFFAVTEHNHSAAESSAGERKDGILIATNHDLYNSPTLIPLSIDGRERKVRSVLEAARMATDEQFLAIYGQEFSTISSGNHVNVLGAKDVITVGNGKYSDLYDQLSTSTFPVVVQLNHPDVYSDLFYQGARSDTTKKMYNDYGLDDYERSFAKLVAAADKHVHLIEVLSGPFATKDKRVDNHRYEDHGDDYYFYLTQGFHISPSVGHDDHYRHWGDKSPARTGVYSEELTIPSLFQAMQDNRTFATEDQNMAVNLHVNDAQMGSNLTLERDTPLQIRVDVNDKDEPNQTWAVTLIYGTVEPQAENGFEVWREIDGEQETKTVEGDGAVVFDGYLASTEPEFYYAIVEQEDGNRAWTAPVWINHPATGADLRPVSVETYVWTSNRSKYYHHDWCTVAGSILSKNRVEGPTPPDDRQLHSCTRSTGESEH
ncbi:MAG: hypothetical protein AMXMBFR84_42520 [Candidatus Hydrogenedentota bacterium]